MGLLTKTSSLFIFSAMIFLTVLAADDEDIAQFVYKECAAQDFQDPTGVYSDNLKTLLSSLVSHSDQAKSFFNTTYGEPPNAVKGIYQCRGDLTTFECNNCVTKIATSADTFCGKAVAVRVQLTGCYLSYEIVAAWFEQGSSTKLVDKVCPPNYIQDKEPDFIQQRDSAFDELGKGVENGITTPGFYKRSHSNWSDVPVDVLGQCDGDLERSDCGDCVRRACYIAMTSECGHSLSGQIYLKKCYISFKYQGLFLSVPTPSSPDDTNISYTPPNSSGKLIFIFDIALPVWDVGDFGELYVQEAFIVYKLYVVSFINQFPFCK